eukprot:Em0001g3753a
MLETPTKPATDVVQTAVNYVIQVFNAFEGTQMATITATARIVTGRKVGEQCLALRPDKLEELGLDIALLEVMKKEGTALPSKQVFHEEGKDRKMNCVLIPSSNLLTIWRRIQGTLEGEERDDGNEMMNIPPLLFWDMKLVRKIGHEVVTSSLYSKDEPEDTPEDPLPPVADDVEVLVKCILESWTISVPTFLRAIPHGVQNYHIFVRQLEEMANAKPLLLPEVFGGEPQSWTEWLEHFESVAAINKWESAEEKMKWLKVRITGQARMAFRKFPASSVQTKYEECTKAFKQRFEPDSKKELYRAELTTRTRRRDEDWATYGDVLRTLADKAYSDLEKKARERLALGQFLSNIENPQVAFGVRQKCPETLDAAVRMTIELESYLKMTTTPTPVVAAATSADESEPLSKALQLLNERLDKLEVMVVSKSNPSSQEKQDTDRAKDAGKRGPICWNCGKRGHIARRCWSGKNSKQQENFKPSMFNGSFVIASDLWVEAIVGLDFIRAHKCVTDCSNNTISFKSADVSVELLSPKAMEEMSSTVRSIGLVTTERILVPPECEMELMVTPVDNTVRALGGVWMVENDSKLSHGVIVARAITCPSDGLVPIRILNPRECSIELKKGTELAKMDHIEQGSILNVSVTTSRESSTTNQLLWEMVNKVGDCLGTKEKEQLYVLLQEYADVFCFRSNELGRTSVLRHHINIENASPIHQLPRRVPQARREEVRRLLREMLDNGVIEPSDSSWSSPVVLAKKKDGSLRFCVDYRKVNAVTRKDAYLLPRVDDTLDTLGGSKFFTTLDLASGYWQVEVATEDRPKTAFVTPEGLFLFKVMPFGLCNAPATFQRLMDRVLGGLKWSSCLVYFDDIIVIGSTFSEHLKHLAAVLTHLRQSGLKLNPTKCKLCQQQVTFLGHIVSTQGISTDPEKVEVIAKWPTPQSKRDVQQFLGLANYYRRFINFGVIAKPLNRLTEKNTTFEWSTTCQRAFENLRNCLVEPPVLAYPNDTRDFLLDTDASNWDHRSLSRQEQRYCVTRRELLAVVEFTQHFRHYLLGRKFILRTYHGSLVWLRNFKEPEGQLARWLERLEECPFAITLSAVWGRDSHTTENSDVTLPEVMGVVTSSPFQTYSTEEMRKLQMEDTIIGPVFAAVKSGRRPLADQVLKELHEGAVGGHLGESKMLGRLKERFYWPSCSEAVSDWCKSCIKCATRKTTVPKPRAGLQTIRAGYPMQIVCVDIMGPLPETERGSKYVLVVADYYTKWVEVYGIPNQEATTVAVKLVDEMFCRFSPPEQLHSDQGRQFESQLIKEICNLLHIRKSHTTPYRPQGNGMVERFNRTLLDMLATVEGDHPSDWEMYIRKLCFAYNTSTHSSTGFTPFYLMFGRQASIPVDLMFPFNLGPEKELRTYVEQLRKGLRDAYAIVRDNCDADHRRQKALYDRNISSQPFGKGALVWLFNPAVPRGKCKKLHHPWKGPFVVVEKVGDSTYKIQRKEGGKFHIVHFDRLKRCNLSESRDDPTPLPTPPLTAHPDGDGHIEKKDELVLLDDDDDDDDNLDREIAEQIIPERNLLGQGQAVAEVPLANPEAAETIRRYPARHRRAPDRYGPYVSF